jgi:WD40 repeat protein
VRFFEVPDTFIYETFDGFVAVSPDGRYRALHSWTSDSLNVVYLWELETGALKFRSTPHPNDVTIAFAFSEDSRYFAWGGAPIVSPMSSTCKTWRRWPASTT